MITVTVDMVTLSRDVYREVRGLDAWKETLENVGRGEVTVGQRRKMSFEKTKPPHGMHIANILAKKGKSPFLYSAQAEREALDFLNEEVLDAVRDAVRTQCPQTNRLRRVLRAAAEHLAESAADHVKRGVLGVKKGSMSEGRRKYWLRTGRWNPKYAFVSGAPPYGIATGRFVEGFKGGWSLGRRRGGGGRA